MLLLAGLGPAAAAGELVVLLLAEPAHPPHAQLLSALREGLDRPGGEQVVLQVTPIDELADYVARLEGAQRPVVVAVGTAAAADTLRPALSLPIIYTLLTRAEYELVRARRAEGAPGAESTAIFIDQPFSRQLRLLRAALPMIRRIGILVGPSSAPYVTELRRALAHTARLDVQWVRAPGDVMPALQRTLARSDAIFALPDPLVYNPTTAKNILLTTYRHRVPVVGFSKAYVKAGAIAAVYSTPEHVGAQLAELLLELASQQGLRLPPPAYPHHYDVAVNPTVANSLGIHLLPAGELRAILRHDYLETEPVL